MTKDKIWDLIIVGLGDLGSRVALAQTENNRSVLGIRRQNVNRPYATIPLDIHGEEIESLKLRCKCLMYSVAAKDKSETEYNLAYPEGLARVQKYIAADCTIYVGSTRVYSGSTPGWIDENTTPDPVGYAGQLLAQAEQQLNSGDCCVHLGGIYGPGRDRLVRLAKAGAWSKTGHLTNRIHIEDASRICQLLIDRHLAGQPIPNRVLGVDGQASEMASVLDWLRQELGSDLNPNQQISPQGTTKKCRSIVLKELGFRFQYPDFQQGYQSLISYEE